MSKPKMLSLVVVSLFLATLWGCGSNMDSDSSTTPTVELADATRTGNCTVCHTVGVHTQVGVLVGQNPDALGQGTVINHDCEACHGGGQYHHGDGPIPYPAPDVTRCVVCHADADKVPSTPHVVNGVANCSGCHSPLTLAKDAVASCSDCHTAVAAKVNEGKHAIQPNTHNGTCGRCHSVEGYLAFSQTGLDFGGVYNATGSPTYDGASSVSCAACHDPHTAALRIPAGWNVGSAQYNLCTSCHNLTTADGTPIASGLPVGPLGAQVATVPKQQHSKDWYRNIATTHYDLATTGYGLKLDDGVTLAPLTIEGYNVRANRDSACTDCHGHELYTNTGGLNKAIPDAGASTIHTDWAQSAHAGTLLANKLAASETLAYARTTASSQAIMTAGANDDAGGNAWTHYNWDGASRQSCQKCHTATGAANYLDAVAAFNAGTTATVVYAAADNDFSHLKNWTTTTRDAAGQNELLYCWGCHTSVETGAIRKPGAMPADYIFEGGTAKGTFPDVTASNLCLACHGGRSGGMNVKAALETTFGQNTDLTWKKQSLTNSHYLAAAGTLFKSIGYEYEGTNRSYANRSSFAHDKLGTVNPTTGVEVKLGTGTSGPCVACHMGNGSAEANHQFKLGGFQGGTCGTGTIVGACHTTMTQTELDIEKEDYEEALFALSATLKAQGYTWTPVNPYIAAADYTKAGTVSIADAKQMLGAAFNLNYLLHEPGGFAHNRYYVKRLIIDSLDFAFNGVLETLTENATVGYFDGSDAGDAIQAAVGLTYADHAGVVQTYTQAQADIALGYLDGSATIAGFQRR